MTNVDIGNPRSGKIFGTVEKVAKYEAEKWVPLLPGVVVRNTPDGIKIEMPR